MIGPFVFCKWRSVPVKIHDCAAVLRSLHHQRTRRPPSKKRRVWTSAARPASSANVSIGFVSCPDTMQLDTASDLSKLYEAIQYLIDLGAAFISVTSAKPGTDMSMLLQRLRPLIERLSEGGASLHQTCAGPDNYFCTATSISFWSVKSLCLSGHQNVDPEGGAPAHGLYFNTNLGKVVVFAASWPVLPVSTKTRMMKTSSKPQSQKWSLPVR